MPSVDDLRQALGNPVLDAELLDRALTHRSYAYENGGLPTNERLEFLGDSVLGVVVTETLYEDHPSLTEGQLAKLRAAVVNARALAEVARKIGLGEHVKLGRGEEITGGRKKSATGTSVLLVEVEEIDVLLNLIGFDELEGAREGVQSIGALHGLGTPVERAKLLPNRPGFDRAAHGDHRAERMIG